MSSNNNSSNAVGDARRRVKLYVLNENRQWDDRGTGHVTATFSPDLECTVLLVHSEEGRQVLLESRIQVDTMYQKQQGTLIVWHEVDNGDMALSFQEKEGCEEIWEKICNIQGKDPSLDMTQDAGEESEEEAGSKPGDDSMDDNEARPGFNSYDSLPTDINRLDEILVGFETINSPFQRSKLMLAMEQQGYILKLLELYRTCRESNHIQGLHNLYNIFRCIFNFNNNSFFEIMFSSENIMDVIGVLENDPKLPNPSNHREVVLNAKMKQAVPIKNAALLQKIQQTYKVQYIQDVILPVPSVLEENALSSLNSFIFFSKVEIIQFIQSDSSLLGDIVKQISDPESSYEEKKNSFGFCKELCSFAQVLQQQNRDIFYKTLQDLGILGAIATILREFDDHDLQWPAVEVLAYFVEVNPSIVRGFMVNETCKQNGENEDDDDEDALLINLLLDQMLCDTDEQFGYGMQVMNLFKILLDPATMEVNVTKSERTEFLNLFYSRCFHRFIAPILASTSEGGDAPPSKDDYHTALQQQCILELATFCLEHHSYHIRTCIIKNELLKRILVLMRSQHSFLVLSALRFLRRMINLRDDFYIRHITSYRLLQPVVNAFIRNGDRYNLLNSALIEFFEYIRTEDIKQLCSHFIENYYSVFENVDYVPTFKGLQMRYQQQLQRNSAADPIFSDGSVTPPISRKASDDDDSWLEREDHSPLNDEEMAPAVTPPADRKWENEFDLFTNYVSQRRKDNVANSTEIDIDGITPALLGNKAPIRFGTIKCPTLSKTPPPIGPVLPAIHSDSEPKASLVAYDDDEDEEEESNHVDQNSALNNGLESPAKRLKFSFTDQT